MSQVEDLRFKQANHEQRIAKLEALINPLAEEFQKAATAKAANAEDLLSGEPEQLDPDAATGTPPPPQTTTVSETNPEGGMGAVVNDGVQQPYVSEEVKEEPKDATN